MIVSARRSRQLLAVAATAAIVAISGCGDDNEKKADELQKQGQELQEDSAQLQKEAQQINDDVKSGKITAQEGAKQLEAKTEALKAKAKKTTQNAIDAAKDNSNLTDAQRKQLEDAQKQLDATP